MSSCHLHWSIVPSHWARICCPSKDLSCRAPRAFDLHDDRAKQDNKIEQILKAGRAKILQLHLYTYHMGEYQFILLEIIIHIDFGGPCDCRFAGIGICFHQILISGAFRSPRPLTTGQQDDQKDWEQMAAGESSLPYGGDNLPCGCPSSSICWLQGLFHVLFVIALQVLVEYHRRFP